MTLMKTSPCQLLDDYLDHDLEPAERTRFVAHLPECASCRQAVEEHERLKTLLAEAVDLERVPENLITQIEAGLRLWRRRRRWIAAAAALTAAAATILLVARNLSRTPEPDWPVVQVGTEPPVSVAPPTADPVRITFPPGANVLVVREKSESPNITIVRVYSGQLPTRARGQSREATPSIPERSEQ